MERVQNAATELGYHTNEGARALRTSRSKTLGVICYEIRHVPLPDFLDGFGAGAEAAGFSMLVANARGDHHQYSALIRRLSERRIDGLLVANYGDLAGLLRPLQESGVPVLLTLWRTPTESDLPLVTCSETSGIRAGVAKLKELGHQALAYIGTSRTLYMPRPSSLAQACNELQVSCEMTFLSEPADAAVMAGHLSQMMHGPVEATAVALNYSLVRPFVGAMRLLGLRIPEDLSVFTFTDGQITNDVMEPPLSSIYTDVVEMGRRSAELLTDWIGEGKHPPNFTDLDLSTWVETESVGAPRETNQVGLPSGSSAEQGVGPAAGNRKPPSERASDIVAISSPGNLRGA
jgi:LacI family transcriptional regulator